MMKENDNVCVACGCLIPEGRQICPKCSSEEFKVDDAVEQAYRRGYAAGLKDNKKLLLEVLPVLRAAFFANYKNQDKADELYCRISQILEEE